MRLRHADGMAAVDSTAWNACFPPDYPFTRHEFLSALEASGAVTAETGWTPCHALVEDAAGALLAAVPLYLKAHSYGEFVFDFSWAQASHRIGRPYYPKLLTAVPFTPAAGPRIGSRSAPARQAVATALATMARDSRVSSHHALFLDAGDAATFAAAGYVERTDMQFHWHNQGYADFAAFAATLTSEKRKKLLRERRRVAEAGLRFEVQAGSDLRESDWHAIYALYANTYEERGQAPYLTLDFFLRYGGWAASPLRLICAYDGPRRVAVAITVRGGDTLYGRHWGAADRYHSLHFETCYYQGIDYCIREGLSVFDAGAQGEHKLARGFVPVTTRSAHWLADARLHQAVDQAMGREREHVRLHGDALAAHAPYRQDIRLGMPATESRNAAMDDLRG